MNALDAIHTRIKNACSHAQRDFDDIELIAVSKLQSVEKIKSLYDLGQRSFGENYGQELIEKRALLKDHRIKWAFIGQLQSNKIKKIVECSAEIHSVTSFKQAKLIEESALFYKKIPYPIYISVNLAEEATKGGIILQEVENFVSLIHKSFPSLRIMGLMAIPPQGLGANFLEDGIIPHSYQEIAILAKKIGEGKLSLGMSEDLELAIKVGATAVRVGSALFGERKR